MPTDDQLVRELGKLAQEDGPRIARHVYFCLLRFGADVAVTQAVEEVVSDVFFTACRLIRIRPQHCPRSREQMLPWVRRIGVLKTLEYVRRRFRSKKTLSADELDLVACHDVIDFLDAHELQPEWLRECKALNEHEREVLQMYFWERMTSTAIADRTGRNSDAVRQTKRRALEKLRQYLQRAGA